MESQASHQNHHSFPPQAHHPPSRPFDPELSPTQSERRPSQQQQKRSPQRQKPRSFSFHSDRSRKSSQKSSHVKENSQSRDSAPPRDTTRLQSKADPTLAISEAEPAEVAAAMTQSVLTPLRSITHKDTNGNPIADPDKSNPTRNRWERPLDTIRSFEAAIDGGYKRKSMIRADTDPGATFSRRNSYRPNTQPRFRPDSYYSSRPVSFRPEYTQFDMPGGNTARNSVYETQGYNGGNYYGGAQYGGNQGWGPGAGPGPGPGPGPSRQRGPQRMATEPNHGQYGKDQNVYHLAHKDRSYETVTSAANSGTSEPLGYQTDPTSSDNSSIERNTTAKRSEPANDYGIGFSQPQSYQNSNLGAGLNGHSKHPLPPPPAEKGPANGAAAIPRKSPSVIRRQPVQKQQPPVQEKRKSWFARRFSKNA